jgi:hypothetical protein
MNALAIAFRERPWLKEGADIVTPEPELLVQDLPLPPTRDKGSRPSPEELVESDKATKNEAI